MGYTVAECYLETKHGSLSLAGLWGVEKVTLPERRGDVWEKKTNKQNCPKEKCTGQVYTLNTEIPNGLSDDFS